MAVKVAAIYRVSTEKQVNRDGNPEETIPVQRRAVQEFLQAQPGWQLVQEYAEEGVSGYKLSADDRDILQQALADAKKGLWSVLVVFKADRLSRNSLEYPIVLNRFHKMGVQVWSVKDAAGGKKLSLDSQSDKIIRFIEGWQAETESYNTSIRVSEAMLQMARAGKWTGGRIPFGYKMREAVRRKKRDGLSLEIHPTEAGLIQEMATWYLEGLGSKVIADLLNSRGLHTKEGAVWKDNAVRRVLQNPLVAGLPAYNRTRAASTGRSRVLTPPYDLDRLILPRDEEGNLAPLPELQILPLDTWFQVLERMKQNNPRAHGPSPHPKAGRVRDSQALLTGLLRCGHCGATLVSSVTYRTKRRRDGTMARYQSLKYICNTHRQAGAGLCAGQRTYARGKVDTTVLGEVETFMQGVDVNELLQLVQVAGDAQQARQAEAVEQLQAELAKCEKLKAAWLARLDQYLLDPAGSMYSEETLAVKVREEEERSRSLQEQLRQHQAYFQQRQAQVEQIEAFTRLAPHWLEHFRQADTARRKALLAQVMRQITVFKTHIDVEFAVDLAAFFAGADEAAVGMDSAGHAIELGARSLVWH